jgi:predicted CxxxxCH...CXXCH cytochrome family protein
MKTHHIPWVGLLVAALLAFYGCSELKTDLPAPVAPGVQAHDPGWMDTSAANFHGKSVKTQGDVQPCLECHGSNYQGGYSGVSCVACHQATGGSVHGRGWTDPTSSNFHGAAIRTANWDMRPCQTCHGTMYEGGKVNSSCRTCHTGTGGPEGCATCHGSTNPAPPRDLSTNTSRSARGVGAHQVHYAGTGIPVPAAVPIFCLECHTTPGPVYAPGHIDLTAGAEVLFNGPAANTRTNESWTIDFDPSLPLYIPTPSYDQGTLRCSNTYCHGNFKNGNLTFAPRWNDTTAASGVCGTCHGDVAQPPNTIARVIPKWEGHGGTHPPVVTGNTCATCHGDVVDANYRIINAARHINGRLSMRDLSGNFVERDF